MHKKKQIIGYVSTNITLLAAFSVVLIFMIILLNILVGGWSALSWNFIFDSPKNGMTEGGIFPAIYGTFLLVIIMSIIGIPIGVITALYLSEYTSENSKYTRLIRFAITNLASIPSIVFGLFGLGFFVQFIGGGMDYLFSEEGSFVWKKPSLLWAATTLAILTLPVVIVSVEETLKSIPKDYREASYVLGATRWQTIWHVVLPQAKSGILTGAILAISRGAGEVAPLLFTGAAFYLPIIPDSFSDQFMHLGYHLYILSTQSVDTLKTLPNQYATSFVLLALVFLLNITAIIIRYRFRKELQKTY